MISVMNGPRGRLLIGLNPPGPPLHLFLFFSVVNLAWQAMGLSTGQAIGSLHPPLMQPS